MSGEQRVRQGRTRLRKRMRTWLMCWSGWWLSGSIALANDGVPPELHELMQAGPDVVITLRIFDEGGEPGVDEAYTVGREGAEPLVAGHMFNPADAVQVEVGCRHYSDQDLCVGADPDDSLCIDCDEDGLPECSRHSFENWCERELFFELVDTCAPPGEATYLFSADEWSFSQSENLLVVATGEQCEAAGCGCEAASSGWTAPATGALMMLIGLLGFRRERQAED